MTAAAKPVQGRKLSGVLLDRAEFRQPLLRWYRRHKRELPWRQSRDAYPVWISEIMLQQTLVATVVPYFERFMAALPTASHLAKADEQTVFKLWEGLGYYRRARQLHRAARQIVADHGGAFPDDLDAIRALPGIGRYTAGAIGSIAFELRTPILEANTVRLLSRLAGYRGDVASTAGQKYLWQLAESLLPKRGCGEFNQALMELGSQVCTPKRPVCTQCPVAQFCAARRRKLVNQIPRPKRRPAIEQVREAAVVVCRGGKVLLRQRPPGERWAGLWDFPRFEVGAPTPELAKREVVAQLRERFGVSIEEPKLLATLQHSVTRFRITLDCFRAETRQSALPKSTGTWRWVRLGELADYPLSTTGRKLARLVAK